MTPNVIVLTGLLTDQVIKAAKDMGYGDLIDSKALLAHQYSSTSERATRFSEILKAVLREDVLNAKNQLLQVQAHLPLGADYPIRNFVTRLSGAVKARTEFLPAVVFRLAQRAWQLSPRRITAALLNLVLPGDCKGPFGLNRYKDFFVAMGGCLIGDADLKSAKAFCDAMATYYSELSLFKQREQNYIYAITNPSASAYICQCAENLLLFYQKFYSNHDTVYVRDLILVMGIHSMASPPLTEHADKCIDVAKSINKKLSRDIQLNVDQYVEMRVDKIKINYAEQSRKDGELVQLSSAVFSPGGITDFLNNRAVASWI